MADYVPAVPWIEDRFDQIMTARWENRIVENAHALYAQAFAGGQAFRSVTMRSPYLRGGSATTGYPVWYGYYRHTNRYLSGFYTIYRAGLGIAIDNAEDPFRPGTFYDPTGDRYYVEDPLEDSVAGLQIKTDADDPDDPTDWTTIRTDTHSAASDLTVELHEDITALPLTVGNIYRVRVFAANCAITVARLWAEGAIDSYDALPAVDDGFVLAPAQWNVFIDDQAYCRSLTAAPASGFSGIYNREGNPAGDTTFTTIPFVGRIRHTGPTLRYRIGVAGTGIEQAATTDWPGAWTGSGVTRLMTLYGGTATFVDGTNDIKPDAGHLEPEVTGEFDSGARVRILRYPSDTYLSWRWVEGEWTVDPSIPVGDWYDIYLETYSDSGEGFRVRVDFIGELATEGGDDLTSELFVANDYVRGDTAVGAGTANWQLVVDDMAVVKAACDEVIQVLTPDTSNHLDRELIGPLTFVRQRPWLYWAGGDADNHITLAVGSPTEYRTQDLGYSDNGLLDLTSVEGLDVGTLYWITPADQVKYAFEGFAE